MSIEKHCQQGVSLIEAMIALLVISIGLLGIASLQITAMSQNTSSQNHSQAVWIAYNMSDRIRANAPQFDNYAGIDTDDLYTQTCEANTCTSVQILEADATDWTRMMENLPGGRGMITASATPAEQLLWVIVMWDDEGTGATGTGCDPDKDTDLTCYRMAVSQ